MKKIILKNAISWIQGFKFTTIFFALGLIMSISAYSQTAKFQEITAKTLQSYSDRGYTLVNHTTSEIDLFTPLATPEIDILFNTYYIVLVQVDACVFCSYELKYVDDDDNLLSLDYEFVNEDGIKQAIYKFQNSDNREGKYVVFIDTDLPYFANIYVFKR